MRSLQRLGLDQDQADVAAGQVLLRRYLLTAIPTGQLKGVEGLSVLLRATEQVMKSVSARRRGRAPVPVGPMRRKQVPTAGRPWRGSDGDVGEGQDDAGGSGND